MIKPAAYWRHQQELRTWMGKVGEVVAVTTIYNSTPEFNEATPYDFALVDFAGERRELMGVGGEQLAIGDKVECVLRKQGQPDAWGLIKYGLKIQKIEEQL